MFKKFGCMLLTAVLFLGLSHFMTASAATDAGDKLAQAEKFVDQALSESGEGHLPEAKDTYHKFTSMWLTIEEPIKTESGTAYSDIESHMGQVEYAFIQNKQPAVVHELQGLQAVNQKFIQGKYTTGEQFKPQNLSLGDFIGLLQQTRQSVQKQDQNSSLTDIKNVRQSWLSVEGSVVAKSATIYSDSERDMVTVQSMLSANPPDYNGAARILDAMIQYLTPLAGSGAYTIWDAAMIPIREGLEALLVVAALLAFVKKSGDVNRKGKSWIWLGVLSGLAVSVALAIIVKFVFTSGAFGHNNFLISGWTGIGAAVMLLYMSYWLHSKSNVQEWQQYIRSQSQSALDTGRLLSLGVLTFLAVFREGTETVLFLIGMVNQIPLQNLLLGLLIGIGILAVLAYLMLIVGVRLPIRPFFMVSSIIVFYLCVKFTGMGIHSLQLADLLPSTTAHHVPSIDFLALYPSWQSVIPQIMLVLFAVVIVLSKRFVKKVR